MIVDPIFRGSRLFYSWMASGTMGGIIYYGIQLMRPKYFLLYSFLISVIISFLLGTAFGTVSTVGVALIVMAKGGGVNINLAAGAIIAGAYFGDRASPMSSSANLVATITDTNLYKNINNMFKTAIIPFIISLIIYSLLSLQEPLNLLNNNMGNDILKAFVIDWRVLLPAAMIVVLALLRLDIKLSMLLNIGLAGFLAVILQGYSLREIINFIVFGFQLKSPGPLQDILQGGGILSMANAAIVVFISSALSELLIGTDMLNNLTIYLNKIRRRSSLFLTTILTAIATAAFGCNQTMSIVLTKQLLRESYQMNQLDNYQLAMDIENSSVVLAPLIPWNIALFVPATTLAVSPAKITPFLFYLYLIPLCNLIYFKPKNPLSNKTLSQT